jgi:hypothetical protein
MKVNLSVVASETMTLDNLVDTTMERETTSMAIEEVDSETTITEERTTTIAEVVDSARTPEATMTLDTAERDPIGTTTEIMVVDMSQEAEEDIERTPTATITVVPTHIERRAITTKTAAKEVDLERTLDSEEVPCIEMEMMMTEMVVSDPVVEEDSTVAEDVVVTTTATMTVTVMEDIEEVVEAAAEVEVVEEEVSAQVVEETSTSQIMSPTFQMLRSLIDLDSATMTTGERALELSRTPLSNRNKLLGEIGKTVKFLESFELLTIHNSVQ